MLYFVNGLFHLERLGNLSSFDYFVHTCLYENVQQKITEIGEVTNSCWLILSVLCILFLFVASPGEVDIEDGTFAWSTSEDSVPALTRYNA